MNVAKTLFDIAGQDIAAAELLYDSSLYSQSLFHFQQAVEKANKAYGLLNGIIKPEELRSSVGHDPLKIFLRGIESRKAEVESSMVGWNRFPKAKKHEFFSNVETHHQDLSAGEQFLKNFRPEHVVNLNYETLHDILDELEDLSKVKCVLPDNVHSGLNEHTNRISEFLVSIGTAEAMRQKAEMEAFMADPANKAEYMNVIQNVAEKMLDLIFVNYTLYFCALITIPHVSKTRYPFFDTSFDPLKRYNRNFPLVNLQPYFIKLLKKALKRMPSLYTELDTSKKKIVQV